MREEGEEEELETAHLERQKKKKGEEMDSQIKEWAKKEDGRKKNCI